MESLNTFERKVFQNLEVIKIHIQQGTIFDMLGFHGFALKEYLIHWSLCRFSNRFVDWD